MSPEDDVDKGADPNLEPAIMEDALEEEAQDFRLFSALTSKGHLSAQTIRRGEKDYEIQGTLAQRDALEQSRTAMEDVLSFQRAHREKEWIRAWYFPDAWARAPEVSGSLSATDKRRPVHVRDRVVVVEMLKSNHFKSVGSTIPGVKKDQPAFEKLWLLPEEALMLVERGTLDLWWPMKTLEEVFPPMLGGQNEHDEKSDNDGEAVLPWPALPRFGEIDSEFGLPLSLEAAYSLLIGHDGDRGKISLQKYQVYSNLTKAGFRILRNIPSVSVTPLASSPTSLWKWLMSLVSDNCNTQATTQSPLVRPGIYRSYRSIYEQMNIIPRHKPVATPLTPPSTEEPFRVYFHVWKSTGTWSKTRPPSPEFLLAVADAQGSSVPALKQITALLESTPYEPLDEKLQGPRQLYPRLKQGHRSVLVAVVDHGVINYLRFGEGAFGQETLWERFDSNGPRGGKRQGRGGRGGAGRGRGKGRGR